MDYGEVIKRAAHITWRYKFLWVFGIIMALCGQGSGGNPRFNVNYRSPLGPTVGPPEFPAYFPEPLGRTPISVYVVAGLLLIVWLGLISIIVGAIGRSALIKSTARAEAGENISFATSRHDGLATAVPLGLLQLLLAIPLLILGICVAVIFITQFWPFFSQIFTFTPNAETQAPPSFLNDFFAFFPLFFATICGTICIGFIIQLIAGLFRTFGSRAIVLENHGVLSSFSRSWHLFRQNIGATIILTILVVVVAVVVGFVLAIPAMVIMLPLMMSVMPGIISGTGVIYQQLPAFGLRGSGDGGPV